MGLNIETSAPRRSYPSIQELVCAVRDCDDPSAEHHAVEWKGWLDLTKAAGRFAVARGVIGMANRTVDGAKRHFGGLAYLLVGVEPQKIEAMPQWDGQQLHPALAAYLGDDGPVWHSENVEVDGTNVLVITIEAPTAGDRIHTLRKAWSSDDKALAREAAAEGTIFVRRGSSTERANTAEIRALERRLLAGTVASEIDLRVALKPDTKSWAVRIDLSPESIRSMVEHERGKCMEDPPSSSLLFGETPSSYRDRVDQYLIDFERSAASLLTARTVKNLGKYRTQIIVENPTSEAVDGVRVIVRMPKNMRCHFDPEFPAMPERPTTHPFLGIGAVPSISDYSISRPGDAHIEVVDGQTVVTFPVGVMHPHETVRLPAFLILMARGGTESLSTTVSCTSRRGSIDATVEVDETENPVVPWMFDLAEKPAEHSTS